MLDKNAAIYKQDETKSTYAEFWNDPKEWPVTIDIEQFQISKLTRRKIFKEESQETIDMFVKSEWKQLDRYNKVGMFGEPIARELVQMFKILTWVWTYIYKEDPATREFKPKARGTCNGSQRSGIVTLAETYASCVEQPAHRLTWALAAALDLICIGYDVGNAFAEAPWGESEPFFMEVDDQFQDWWTNHLNKEPIPDGHVIPILHALQGHPEAPRLWDKYISKIIVEELKFKATVHEPCLYYRYKNGNIELILRQVDDFKISAKTKQICDAICSLIQERMTFELNEMGLIKKFNGVYVEQTKHYTLLHCEPYIERLVEHHQWLDEPLANKEIPMKCYNKYVNEIQENEGPDMELDSVNARRLEKEMNFNYRQLLGELIYAYTICRLDIAPSLILLSQHGKAPAKTHYEALKHVLLYLYAT